LKATSGKNKFWNYAKKVDRLALVPICKVPSFLSPIYDFPSFPHKCEVFQVRIQVEANYFFADIFH